MPSRLLAIDDEQEICEFVRDVAVRLGFEVEISTDSSAFRTTYLCYDPEVIVMDLMMPGLDGIELLNQLAEDGSKALTVVSGLFGKLFEDNSP